MANIRTDSPIDMAKAWATLRVPKDKQKERANHVGTACSLQKLRRNLTTKQALSRVDCVKMQVVAAAARVDTAKVQAPKLN